MICIPLRDLYTSVMSPKAHRLPVASSDENPSSTAMLLASASPHVSGPIATLAGRSGPQPRVIAAADLDGLVENAVSALLRDEAALNAAIAGSSIDQRKALIADAAAL